MQRASVLFGTLLVTCALVAWGAPASVRAQQPMLSGVPLLPPNAKPGECYTRVYVAPTYETTSEQVLKRTGGEKVEVVPAKFEAVEEQVLIKEEAEKIEVVPATFRDVEEQVLVRPETQELTAVPAQYEETEEQVLVRAAYTTWQTNCGPLEKLQTTTGETLCLVEVPAQYKTVTKRVLKAPPRTEVVKKPAEYKTVKKQVIDKPATTRSIKIPAEYASVKVQKLVEPAREVRTPVPDEFETVQKTVKTADARLEWRQILCEASVGAGVVRKIQAALKEKGFYQGPADGSMGPGTSNALIAFQKKQNLPAGQLTVETLKALGIQQP